MSLSSSISIITGACFHHTIACFSFSVVVRHGVMYFLSLCASRWAVRSSLPKRKNSTGGRCVSVGLNDPVSRVQVIISISLGGAKKGVDSTGFTLTGLAHRYEEQIHTKRIA